MKQIWTVQSILDWTTEYFTKNKIKQARTEAEVLLSSVLDCKKTDLNLILDKEVPKENIETFKVFIKERKKRKPISYIIGNHEFMGLKFKVNEHTLIPRPETEILVEEVLNLTKKGHDKILVDVGAGSGNIAISISKLSKIDHLYAVDISLEALSVCWDNINAHSMAAKIIPKHGDLLEPLMDENLNKKIDIIVSNPPYVAWDEYNLLEPEIHYEPRLALDGGKDGLDFYRRLVTESKYYLKQNGLLVMELNANKSSKIMSITENSGYRIEKIIKDYAGLNRVLVASI
ncbi:MAG: peptide chain release factor N(5)-glutamine methyltransferase [Endomicrobiales bacterium]|nr:peptide chain release factor N(5)-glutamine methyltransferase [Endomicrobiales bacterium]